MGHRKWTVALVAMAVGLALGCQRQATGPSVEDYAKQRRESAKRSPQGEDEAPKSGEASEAEAESGLAAAGRGYIYDPIGKRDPFRSFVLSRKAEEQSSERAPLEQFDLSQLSVTGVIWDADRRRALVRDPSGRSYIVGEGDPMGKNDGKVVRIAESAVFVREAYVDFHGEKTTKEIELRVRQSEGG